MAKNIVRRFTALNATWGGVAAAVTAILRLDISDYKEFSLTIACSSSSGMAYSVFVSPVNADNLFLSGTGGAITAGACATVTHTIVNNNYNFLEVRATSTAVISGSHVDMLIAAIERPN